MYDFFLSKQKDYEGITLSRKCIFDKEKCSSTDRLAISS